MISDEERKHYLEVVGKRGLQTLALINKLSPIVSALNSEFGSQFLNDDIEQHAKLINKVYDSLMDTGIAEQRDVIHLQLLHGRLLNSYHKIAKYEESLHEVKTAKKGETP